MNLLLCYPGAVFSTFDVARGYHSAFSKIEGVELRSFQYEKYLTYHTYAQKFLFAKQYKPEEAMHSAAMDVRGRVIDTDCDWLLAISGIGFPVFVWTELRRLREKLKHPFKVAVLLTESPYVEEWEKGILERIDVAFTTDYGILHDYQEVNPNLFYIKHAYDPAVHHLPSPQAARDVDVFMVGTGFPERQRLLDSVSWDGIDLHLYGNWMYMQSDSPLQRLVRGQMLENSKTAEMYRRSKIALNIFRTVQWPDSEPKFIEPSKAKSISPRCYEALACGAMLLTDWREELDTWPKDAYVVWGDAQDLEDKMRYYLAHDAERQAIADKGHQFVQGETFAKRAKEIMQHLE